MQVQTSDSNPIEEQRWLQAAQRGDTEAYGHIVQRYYRLVISLAYRLSNDSHLAEDVAQDTFIKAWQRLSEFQPEHKNSLKAWLCRIAHNRTVDLLRRTRPQVELGPYVPDDTPNPLRQALAAETSDEVQQAIARLPARSRTALILREYEEMSYAEIATTLDIPIGTVMSRLYHARRQLAAELAPILHLEAVP